MTVKDWIGVYNDVTRTRLLPLLRVVHKDRRAGTLIEVHRRASRRVCTRRSTEAAHQHRRGDRRTNCRYTSMFHCSLPAGRNETRPLTARILTTGCSWGQVL